jgi:alkylation response protein AidB-like acyl-CoA dehydrogenase
VITNALVAEALAHGDMGLAVACLSGPSVATAIAEFGTAEQEAQYLPSLTGATPPQAAIAVMEGGALFNPFALKTRAREKDGGWVLDGEKQLVAMAQQAELLLIAAAGEDDKPALFIVESGTAGVRVEAQPAMGLRPAGLSRVTLKSVMLPANAKLGGAEGADYAQLIALSRLAWSALAVGATSRRWRS